MLTGNVELFTIVYRIVQNAKMFFFFFFTTLCTFLILTKYFPISSDITPA